MIEWLNANAGAVQAFSAACTVLLTVALVVITLWYARVTRRMFDISRRQLSLSMLPRLSLSLSWATGSRREIWWEVENTGPDDIKILTIRILGDSGRRTLRVDRYRHHLLRSGQRIRDTFIARWWDQQKEYPIDELNACTLYVDCSDIVDSETHCYTYNASDGVFLHNMPSDVLLQEQQGLWATIIGLFSRRRVQEPNKAKPGS